MKKNKTTIHIVGILLIAIAGTLGCSSTVTLGPKANESAVVGATASTKGASVTLPLIKAEAKTTTATTKGKKK